MGFASHFPSYVSTILNPNSVLPVSKADKENFTLAALVVIEQTWSARNHLLFEGITPKALDVIQKVKKRILEFKPTLNGVSVDLGRGGNQRHNRLSFVVLVSSIKRGV